MAKKKPDTYVVALALPPIKVPRMPVTYIVMYNDPLVARKAAAKLRRLLAVEDLRGPG